MIHHVFANRSNVGDWLSARGIQALLAPHGVTEHLCDEPFVGQTLDALAEVPEQDLIVIGGGGLLMDYFTPFWEGFQTIAARGRFCLWGVGVVDLKQEPSLAEQSLIAGIAARSRVCRVRDELTRRYIGRERCPAPVPCPSFAAVSADGTAGCGLLHSANYTTVGAAAYEQMRAQGMAFAAATDRPFRETNNRIRPDDEGELEKSVALYRRSDRVLSSRLHGCIIALALGRKVLAVSGDRKVESFMDAAGLGDWVLGLDELDAVPERLGALDGQPPAAQFAAGAIAANRAVAREVVAALPVEPATVPR